MKFLLAIVLLMLLTSCVSKPKVEYKTVVPAITFPEFPTVEWVTENPDNTCTVPSDWIVQLSLFRIRYEATAETYELIKEKVEE